MATDISTLSVTYGDVIAGATLSTILNGATDQIAITGSVPFSGELTLDHAQLDIIGNVNGQLYGPKIRVIDFASIDGLGQLNATDPLYDGGAILFPPTSTAKGIIKNITSMPGYVIFGSNSFGGTLDSSVPDIGGLRFRNIGGYPLFRGKCHNVTLTGIHGSFTTYAGVDNSHSLSGRNNILEDWDITASSGGTGHDNNVALKFSTLHGDYGISSVGNIIRNCTFSAAAEEAVGWDAVEGGANSCTCRVTGVGANTMTLQYISATNLLSGEVAVGRHLLICTGAVRGRYYEIVAQNGTSVQVDTSRFSTTGIAVDDYAVIAISFVDNIIENCTVNMNATFYSGAGFGQHDGISLHGSCLGNIVRDNTLIGVPANPRSTGIHDTGMCHWMCPTGDPYECDYLYNWTMAYIPNSRNVYLRNTFVDCKRDFLARTIYFSETWFPNLPEWNEEQPYGGEGIGKITDTPLALMSLNIQAAFNTSNNPAALCGMQAILDAAWIDNDLATPSIAYDDLHMEEILGQPALGGNTPTTWGGPVQEMTTATRAGGVISLASWVDADVSWAWGSDGFSAYTDSIPDDGGTILHFFAEDATYTEEVQNYSVAQGTIGGASGIAFQLKGLGGIVFPFNIKL